MINPNSLEKGLEPLLQSQFPNYITIRDKYFIPLTGYPHNPNWRVDTHPYLERVGLTAYSILKSINFILHRKGLVKISDPEQSFKNIYFHFGLIFDCVETLSRHIILIEELLEISKSSHKLKQSKRQLICRYNKWIRDEYDKRFNENINFGKPIFYFPHQNQTYLSHLIQNPLKRKYNTFATEVKNYRNHFIHNPGVDVFLEIATNQMFALKKEFVAKSMNWANIQFHFETRKEYFENPCTMINDDFHSLLEYLNLIWIKLEEKLINTYAHERFNRINHNYDRHFEY